MEIHHTGTCTLFSVLTVRLSMAGKLVDWSEGGREKDLEIKQERNKGTKRFR